MMKKRNVAAGILAAAMAVGFTGQAYAGQTEKMQKGEKTYTLDFSDEFNGDSLDTEKWTDNYFPWWSSDQSLIKGNYRFEDGCLVQYITEDQKPWNPERDGDIKSSAIMSFDKSWIHNFSDAKESGQRDTWYGYKTKYGYFELRARMANCGGGGHQAWWMVGLQQDTNDWYGSKERGEIDIIETFFNRQNTWRICTYGWGDPEFQAQWQASEPEIPFGTPTEEFHTYGFEWTPQNLKFYYDDQLVWMIFGAPRYEMGTILNIYTDAGSGPHNDVWPKEWYLDYYRVWKPEGGYDESKTARYYLRNRETGGYLYLEAGSDYVKEGEIKDWRENWGKWEISQSGDFIRLKNVVSGEYLYKDANNDALKNGNVDESDDSSWWRASFENGDLVMRTKEDWNLGICAGDGKGRARCDVMNDRSEEASQWELVEILE